MIYSAATRNQILASDPNSSTWLSANAGSGKTKVLTDRVARLLLSGVLPQKVLCLTYTKAAANEMQNRLFSRLGIWSMMPDNRLRKNLISLGINKDSIDLTYLLNSRKLFAQAIETPGGIKIQTIHSFCSSILRRFPFEAGISPSFDEIDSRRAANLRLEVTEVIATKHPVIFNDLITFVNEADIDSILLEIIQYQKSFKRASQKKELKKLLNIPETYNEISDTVKQVFRYEFEDKTNLADVIKTSINHLKKQSKTMRDISEKLEKINLFKPGLDDLEILFDCFLKRNRKNYLPIKKKMIPTKEAQKALGNDLSNFEDLVDRVLEARDMQLRILSLKKTIILNKFAHHFLSIFESQKDKRGWLDFDDLIHKTVNLLENPTFANYILYRLDGGIDHILIDESQDNSPEQWDVIRLISEDFVSGESSRSKRNRTVFAVGDKKQSIYSFQGADPIYFDKMCNYFSSALSAINKDFQSLNLLHSFRSSKVILDLVDVTFSKGSLDKTSNQNNHIAYKTGLPGRVDIWDWEAEATDEHNTKWYDPVDLIGKQHHSVSLANKIANEIQHQINFGQISPASSETEEILVRKIVPGDFIILVQTRSTIFYEIIRACKELNLPIAGTDRLELVSEIAIKDLRSLLSYLLTPEDDLSLAEVLRSPLCNLSENQLFQLAHNRGSNNLHENLFKNKAKFHSICGMFENLQDKIDYMRPYEIIEHILTFHHGRKKLVSRLGLEVEEVLDVFLEQALEYEHSNVASLTGFLEWVSEGGETIKRSLHASSNKIRIMTIHGAKGLESPIVIIPDTGTKQNNIKTDIIKVSNVLLWRSKTPNRSHHEQRLIENIKEKEESERLRLLYVAMTRAQSWLIICGSGKQQQNKTTSWYQLIKNGFLNTKYNLTKTAKGIRINYLSWPPELCEENNGFEGSSFDLPNWLKLPAPPPNHSDIVISPSDLNEKKSIDRFFSNVEFKNSAEQGTALHVLLDNLSNESKTAFPEKAALLLPNFDRNTLRHLTEKAFSILTNKEFKFIFSKNSFSEVNISAKFSFLPNRRVVGVVDRLIISKTEVIVVDFKSNSIVPQCIQDVPTGILSQMGAYQEILKKIYPNFIIKTAILWTEKEHLMELDQNIVKDAFLKATMS